MCRFVCPLDYSASYEGILIKFSLGVGRGPRTNRVYLDGDSNHDSDPGFVLKFCLLLRFLSAAKNKTWQFSTKV